MMRAKISTNKGIVEEAFAPFHVNIFATELSDLSEKIVMDKVCNIVITHQWEWNKTIWYKWCHQFTIGWRLMNHFLIVIMYTVSGNVPVRSIHNLLQVYQLTSMLLFSTINKYSLCLKNLISNFCPVIQVTAASGTMSHVKWEVQVSRQLQLTFMCIWCSQQYYSNIPQALETKFSASIKNKNIIPTLYFVSFLVLYM